MTRPVRGWISAFRHLVGASILSLVLVSGPVDARPVILVPADSSYAWWARDLILRPAGRSAGGIDLSTVNAWRQSHRGMAVLTPLCKLDAVEPNEIVSADRQTQAEIDETLKAHPGSFLATYDPDPHNRFTVRVVIFEGCGEHPETGSALLITDRAGALRSFDANEFRFARLFKRDDGKLNVSGCFDCGDVSELAYDRDNDFFYYRWIGH